MCMLIFPTYRYAGGEPPAAPSPRPPGALRRPAQRVTHSTLAPPTGPQRRHALLGGYRDHNFDTLVLMDSISAIGHKYCLPNLDFDSLTFGFGKL